MELKLSCHSDHGSCCVEDDLLRFCAAADCDSAFFRLQADFPLWEEDCYVFSPACAYNGNRFRRVVRSYPPIYYK